mmetsp:Transcript_42908/g.96969  ORF Transcript_42908/g.96969 Transcript_42908/m.96969 type:complete len:261 (-) Transcript_42908:60-842(-)
MRRLLGVTPRHKRLVLHGRHSGGPHAGVLGGIYVSPHRLAFDISRLKPSRGQINLRLERHVHWRDRRILRGPQLRHVLGDPVHPHCLLIGIERLKPVTRQSTVNDNAAALGIAFHLLARRALVPDCLLELPDAFTASLSIILLGIVSKAVGDPSLVEKLRLLTAVVDACRWVVRGRHLVCCWVWRGLKRSERRGAIVAVTCLCTLSHERAHLGIEKRHFLWQPRRKAGRSLCHDAMSIALQRGVGGLRWGWQQANDPAWC